MLCCAVLLLLLLPLLPESPRYLQVKGRTHEAEAVLRRIARVCGASMPAGQLAPLPGTGGSKSTEGAGHGSGNTSPGAQLLR